MIVWIVGAYVLVVLGILIKFEPGRYRVDHLSKHFRHHYGHRHRYRRLGAAFGPDDPRGQALGVDVVPRSRTSGQGSGSGLRRRHVP
jgi:hypothetical protein